MTREARNNIGSDVFIDDIGETVNTGETKVIHPTKYGHWAASVDVDAYIDSGDITIIHNGLDLVPAQGKCLVHELTDYMESIKTYPSVQSILRQTKKIRYVGPFWDLSVSGNTLDIAAQFSATAEGKETNLEFFDGGNVDNSWLNLVGANINSDDTPGVITANCKLRAISFTNTRSNASTDIRLYKNGTSIPNLFYTWEIRGSRYAWKTNGLDAVTFSIGDTVRVYYASAPGQSPQNSVCILTFVNTDNVLGEGSVSI